MICFDVKTSNFCLSGPPLRSGLCDSEASNFAGRAEILKAQHYCSLRIRKYLQSVDIDRSDLFVQRYLAFSLHAPR
ncbi:hypothetical protein KM043_018428 [Ampulex compressa]|nr:hypothetical protein KM043_018428 [Ampulex compressa]